MYRLFQLKMGSPNKICSAECAGNTNVLPLPYYQLKHPKNPHVITLLFQQCTMLVFSCINHILSILPLAQGSNCIFGTPANHFSHPSANHICTYSDTNLSTNRIFSIFYILAPTTLVYVQFICTPINDES